EDEVLLLDPTVLMQALDESVPVHDRPGPRRHFRPLFWRLGSKPPDAIHPLRRLRLDSERRGEEADNENGREPDQSHGTPQYEMAPGSLANLNYWRWLGSKA